MQQEYTNDFGSLLEGKVVVADTSSLLMSGTKLLAHIYNCELILPAIVVQELEAKRSHPTLGVLARQWINLLESLRVRHETGLSKGVPYEEGASVILRVEPNHSKQASLPLHLQNGSADSTVLAVAYNLQQDADVIKQVVLLSNDTPMRLYATLDLEMKAHEFVSSVFDENREYTARTEVILTEEEYENLHLHMSNGEIPWESMSWLEDRLSSDIGYRTIVDIKLATNDEDEVSETLLYGNGVFSRVKRKQAASKIQGRTIEQDIALEYLKMPARELPIVSIGGSAGTGKTLLTVATALDGIKSREYQKIVVFRSLHEMGQGQEMGFLPGDVNEKMGPWAGAITDALDVITESRKPPKKNEGPAAVEDRRKYTEELSKIIEVSPITYLRGRSLAKSFIILDEAQNFSRSELLNIVARVGEGSKLVILWDQAQVDNRFLRGGKDADVWSVVRSFKNEDVFGHVTLTVTERSRLAELASRFLEEDFTR